MPFTTNLCQTAGQNQLAGTGQMQAQVASARELLEEAAKGAGTAASAVVRQPQAKDA
jgi:hypothetical protein